MTKETRQYTWLRLTVAVTGLALFTVMVLSSIRLWPIVNAIVHPTTLRCGCAVVAIHTTWWMSVVAVFVSSLTLYSTVRFVYKIVDHIRRYRQVLRELTAAGFRAAWNSELHLKLTVISDQRPIAYTIGIFRPSIIVSEGLLQRLQPNEVSAVLLHERAHQAAFDPLVMMLLESITAAWHWVPGFRGLMTVAYSLRELAADARATDNYRSAESLSAAFVKLHDIAAHPVLSAFSPNGDRLEKLLNHEWTLPQRWWNWKVVIATVALLAGGLFIGRAVRAVNTELPVTASMACHETIVMCQAEPQQATTLKSVCAANLCVTVEHPKLVSSQYGRTQVR